MKRILFVDDEPSLLDGLRRLLRSKRGEWEMSFAGGGADAVRLIEARPFDVVVSDMRMPGVDGAGVLEAARRHHAGSVRLILSGNATADAALCAMGTAHQFLAKPCDPAVLERVLVRICRLQEILADPTLQALVGDVGVLPSPPSTYWALVRALSEPGVSIRSVSRIVERDTAIAAKVLQLVNSSLFGRARQMPSLEHAVSYLGMNVVRSLVLSNETVRVFQPPSGSRFDVEAFQSHSLRVAGLAKRLASDSACHEDAFMAGVLHDVGSLILATGPSAGPAAGAGGANLLHEAELARLGVSHAEVGGYLLGIWGLPHAIVEAVTMHHRPHLAGSEDVAVLAAVHVADVLDHEVRGEPAPALDLAFLAAAGLADRLDGWRETARAFHHECEGES